MGQKLFKLKPKKNFRRSHSESELRHAKKKNNEFDRMLSRDHNEFQQINRLLVLGAGGVGKSTLYRQMIRIYQPDLTPDDPLYYRPIIYRNCIRAIQIVSELTERYFPDGPSTKHTRLLSKKISKFSLDTKINDFISTQIATLWKDPYVQQTYQFETARGGSSELKSGLGEYFETYNESLKEKCKILMRDWFPQELETLIFLYARERVIPDSCKYYLDRIYEIGLPEYIPNESDIVHYRIKTKGIIERSFVIDGNRFELVDVGGQRNERKKWIGHFDHVTLILFVADLSGYDRVLYEDENTNRMVEDLNLFEEICNHRYFKKTSIIFFLNKRDIFQDKIQRIPLTRGCFPDYTGANTYEATSTFIQEQFLARNKNTDRQIYPYITCGTDKDNIKFVFNATKDVVIRRSLQEGGLLS